MSTKGSLYAYVDYFTQLANKWLFFVLSQGLDYLGSQTSDSPLRSQMCHGKTSGVRPVSRIDAPSSRHALHYSAARFLVTCRNTGLPFLVGAVLPRKMNLMNEVTETDN